MTKPQRIAAWEAKIVPIVEVFQRLRDATDNAHAAGTLDPNGELFRATWCAFEELLGMLDAGGWICWSSTKTNAASVALKLRLALARSAGRSARLASLLG
jgi:hypothetical protein